LHDILLFNRRKGIKAGMTKVFMKNRRRKRTKKGEPWD